MGQEKNIFSNVPLGEGPAPLLDPQPIVSESNLPHPCLCAYMAGYRPKQKEVTASLLAVAS